MVGYVDCTNGRQHFKYCTLNSIRGEAKKLHCPTCHGLDSAPRWASEQEFIKEAERLSIDEQFVFQVHVGWWEGLIDFAHIPPLGEPMEQGIYIQVDGSSHFTENRGVEVPKKLESDLGCCMAALNAHAKLIRLHWKEMHLLGPIMADAQQCGKSSFVMLSPGFRFVKSWGPKVEEDVPELLKQKLGQGFSKEESNSGAFVFFPL
jgi:hypothetical protein